MCWMDAARLVEHRRDTSVTHRAPPFGGRVPLEVFEEIKRRFPKPPRMIRPDIPAELERICLKCLENVQTDRYASAAELSDDLEAWSRHRSTTVPTALPDGQPLSGNVRSVAAPTDSPAAGSMANASEAKSDKQHILRIVPKGLRSFDKQDADFFLELLPGPRDRDGLPESIRFWKRRIEQQDPQADISSGPDLWAERLWKIIAGEGGLVAPPGVARRDCLSGGHA